MKALLELITRLRNAWQARLPRERQMLAAMAVVLLATALWSLWDWTHSERLRLARVLPAAQTALAGMRDDAAELQRLLRQPPRNPPPAAALAETLQSGAKARGLGLTVKPEGDNISVTGTANFDASLNWLGEAQRDYGLRVARMNVHREAGNGQIELLLSPAVAR